MTIPFVSAYLSSPGHTAVSWQYLEWGAWQPFPVHCHYFYEESWKPLEQILILWEDCRLKLLKWTYLKATTHFISVSGRACRAGPWVCVCARVCLALAMLRPILFFPSTPSLLLIAGITSNSGVSSKQGMLQTIGGCGSGRGWPGLSGASHCAPGPPAQRPVSVQDSHLLEEGSGWPSPSWLCLVTLGQPLPSGGRSTPYQEWT